MKHLFFVAVAIGIFSGTSITVKAQTSINSAKSSGNLKFNHSIQFIEGIEIKNEFAVAANSHSKLDSKRTVTSAKSDSFGLDESTIESSTSLQFKYAQLMDLDVESVTNSKLYQVIEEWWATRYVYGGTSKRGIDCSAYTGTLIKDAYGITLPRTAHEQYAFCEKISRYNLIEGDLVFFNTIGGVSHVGLYLGNGYFTHSSVHSGVTISSLNENYYSQKFIGGGRVGRL